MNDECLKIKMSQFNRSFDYLTFIKKSKFTHICKPMRHFRKQLSKIQS